MIYKLKMTVGAFVAVVLLAAMGAAAIVYTGAHALEANCAAINNNRAAIRRVLNTAEQLALHSDRITPRERTVVKNFYQQSRRILRPVAC